MKSRSVTKFYTFSALTLDNQSPKILCAELLPCINVQSKHAFLQWITLSCGRLKKISDNSKNVHVSL